MDDTSAEVRFGPRLRELRLRAGLSQVALAGEELHPSYVSLLEAGKRRPTRAAVRVLAARLGISVDELVRDTTFLSEDQVMLAEAALGSGRPADAVVLVQEALARGVELDRTSTIGFRFGMTYATALERTGRLDDAIAEYERLRAVAETLPQRHSWLPVVIALVRCYRDTGDLARAADLGEAAVGRCNELGLVGIDGHAALVSTLAGVYCERSDHVRAKVLLDDLIERVEQGESLADRAYAYWTAAINAAGRGYMGEGLRLSERAAALLAETDDQRSRVRIEVTRAWVLLVQDPPDPVTARRLLRATLPGLRLHAGAGSMAYAEVELARCEMLLGRPEVAVRLVRSALKRMHPEHRLGRARALLALGAALVSMGETAAGALELASAAQALNDVGSDRQAAPIWRQLSDLFRSLGDSERALYAADRAMDASGVVREALVPTVSDSRP